MQLFESELGVVLVLSHHIRKDLTALIYLVMLNSILISQSSDTILTETR